LEMEYAGNIMGTVGSSDSRRRSAGERWRKPRALRMAARCRSLGKILISEERDMTDERAFLKAILEKPDDDSRKLVYADWLEEQGDPRAEYLRLTVKARQERVVSPEQRQRHQELSAELATLRTQEVEAWHTNQGSSRQNRDGG